MHRINGKKLENEKVNFEFSENLNYIKKTSVKTISNFFNYENN